MAINLGSAAATLSLDVSDFIRNAQRAADALKNLTGNGKSVSTDLDNVVDGADKATDALDDLAQGAGKSGDKLVDLGQGASKASPAVDGLGEDASRASDGMDNLTSTTDKAVVAVENLNNVSTNGGFLNWVNQNEASLTKWGKGMLAVGGIITGAFAAPIIAGSKAAWGQVSAVEQATSAMNAYADSTEQVDGVIADLLAYARSDMGVLFSRQELFAAAQSMLIYGASIEDVTGYTEILSRSVGLGLSDWDTLNTVIGRVGATGKLTGNDFDMLTARGFKLDESLRNTNITWEELFVAMDQGFPADALAGQADTIRGKSIRLQSALRGLGLAFLGVDSETSKFIEGGLGWQMMRGMERLTLLMKRAAPAVQGFGNVFAAIGRPIGQIFDLLLKLPQPVQTGILMFTALSGVALTAGGSFLLLLPRIASTIAAFQALGGMAGVLGGVTKAVGALRVAMLGLFMNPAMLAAIAIIGAGILAYKTNFLGFGDMVRDALGWVQDLWAALQLVFGKPVTNTATLEVGALLDVPYSEWVEMPDGTVKNATLGLTATGTGLGIVSWVANPDSPDGKDWTITIDADGDGKDDALTILNSKDHKDGTYTLEASLTDANGEVQNLMVWHDTATGQTHFYNLDASEAIEQLSEVEQLSGRINEMAKEIQAAWVLVSLAIQEVVGWIETAIGLTKDLWNAIHRGRDESDFSDPGGDQPGEGGGGNSSFDFGGTGGLFDTKGGDVSGKLGGIASAALVAAKSMVTLRGAIGSTTAVVPPLGTSMNTTASQVQGAGGIMGSTFSTIASTAAARFTEARNAAATQFGGMNTSASSQASSMAASVGGHFLGMQTRAAVQMALMASAASTQGSAMNTGLAGWISGAVARVAAGLAGIPGIIRSVGSTGASAGYYAGSMISQGFANGMLAYLGMIQGAANAMVNAASAAVIAKAMISSPSRLFKQYGAYIGEGLERGILSTVGDVGRASDMLIGATLPQPGFAGGFGGGQQVTYIDNSQYFTVTTEEMAMIKNQAQRGNQAADHLIGARNTNGFVGRGGV